MARAHMTRQLPSFEQPGASPPHRPRLTSRLWRRIFDFLRRPRILTAIAAFTASQWTLADSFLLTGATVHTVSGETLSPGQVLVRDGKIAAVGASVPADGT